MLYLVTWKEDWHYYLQGYPYLLNFFFFMLDGDGNATQTMKRLGFDSEIVLFLVMLAPLFICLYH